MINYKKCSEVNMDLIFDAFTIGFSDYIIKLSMPKDIFFNRFFGPEGNSLDYSHIAFDGDKAIGVILGGIKNYEGIKTMRCGTLAVHPKYRGQGISQKLMELHKEVASKNNCKQLFLEVIVGNDRAVKFYNNLSYEKVYDLKYFSLEDLSTLRNYNNPHMHIKKINFVDFKNAVGETKDYHINWQSDIDYVETLENSLYYGAYVGETLVGYLCGNTTGKINILWVNKNARNKGFALGLLSTFSKEVDVSKLSITVPNNHLMEGFIRHIGFKKDSISQYEMYLNI